MKRKVATILIGLLATAGVSIASAPSAMASGNGYVRANTPIYRCPWRGCAISRLTYYNAWLPFDCYTDSNAAGPFERWFRISGGVGYIQAWRVGSQPRLPHC